MKWRRLVYCHLLLLLLLSLIAFNIRQAHADLSDEPTSWLTGYSYRKRHLINGSNSAQTNYTVQITVHYGSGTDSGQNVYLNQHGRVDFADIRFTQDDGFSELSFWIERMNFSDYAVFWVRIPSLSSAQTEMYIYYGNPNISVAPDEEIRWVPPPNSGSYKITVNTSSWDVFTVEQCALVKNPDDGKYYLFYSGCDALGNFYGIGYATATSILGIYTKSPNNPILPYTSSEGWGEPNLIYEEPYWYMFAGHQNGSVQAWHIGLWKTTNLTDNDSSSWTFVGYVLNGTKGEWDENVSDASVVKQGNKYYMMYEGFTTLLSVEIGVAVSDNIEHGWKKYSGNPVIGREPNSWKHRGISNPTLVVHDNVFYSITCGATGTGMYGAMQVASSTDGHIWTVQKPFGRKGAIFTWSYKGSTRMSPYLYEEDNMWYMVYQEGTAYVYIIWGYKQGNPVTTFDLFDDFPSEQLNFVWSNIGTGWNLTKHVGCLQIDQGRYDETIRSKLKFGNFTLKFKYFATSLGNRVTAIYLRADNDTSDGYSVELEINTGKVAFWKRESGIFTLSNNTQSYGSPSLDVWYTAKYLFNCTTLKLTEWNEETLSPQPSITDTTFQNANYVGFRSNNSKPVFDWIFVTKYVHPEPSHDVWDYETYLVDSQRNIFVNTNATLNSASFLGEQLNLNIELASGTSQTKVYCGDKGKPKSVIVGGNEIPVDYNETTKILTVHVTHSSSQNIEINWAGASAEIYILTVYVQQGSSPVSNVDVTVNGEVKQTNLLGTATFELPYGHFTVRATLNEKTKTVHVLMKRDKKVGITFGKGKKSRSSSIFVRAPPCL